MARLVSHEIPPFGSVPSGSSGHEGRNGVDHPFESVPGANGPHSPEVGSFARDVFSLRAYSTTFVFGVVVSVSDSAGPPGSLGLLGCAREDLGTGQTVLGPGGGLGVPTPGFDRSQVHLPVRA
ncbi:MAG TPA: hypothetical protein VN864_04205 [Thermoplasmata archaeon]|nr:hypothetical protein [Thermoplasmata archaeon]